jgi:hypothetical protein
MWTKIAWNTTNNIDYKAGTILFWLRREKRTNEIPYAPSFTGDPSVTWSIGPDAMNGHRGEGLVGAMRTPQESYSTWFTRVGNKAYKPGSDGFIGLRRYKKVDGVTDGFLEAYYQAMHGKIYHVQADYQWVPEWRHVALVWDMEARRLEIYLDGQKASDQVNCNGSPSTDTVWYGVPWDLVMTNNDMLGIVQASAEGGRSSTMRDEYYVYNKALSLQEIQDNMQKSMGKVVTPIIFPGDSSFSDSLRVEIKSHWSNPTHRYTTDGNDPSTSSSAYTQPLVITANTTLKVRSFLQGYSQSDVAAATFTYLGMDTQKPKVSGVTSINTANQIMVFFDKVVDKTTAETASNYTVDNGINITAAALDYDGQTVRLTTSAALDTSVQYNITVKNVKDMSKSSNVMDDLVDQTFKPKTLDGLIGFWTFDVLPHERVKDLSPTKMDGYILDKQEVNYGAGRVQGYRGKGYYFDYDDMVDVTDWVTEGITVNQDAAHNLDSGTIAMWFKANPKSGSSDLIYKEYAYEVYYWNSNIYINCGGHHTTGVRVADGSWHHLVWTFKRGLSNGGNLYLDGTLRYTHNVGFLNNWMNGLAFGAGGGGYGNGTYNGMKGHLDEIMLFDRALSWPEVMRLRGTSLYLGADEQARVPVKKFDVQVYPNPFGTSVDILVRLPWSVARHEVRLEVFNIAGKMVANIKPRATSDERRATSCTWHAQNQPSGIYFVKVRAGDKVLIRKVGLLR